MKSLWLDAASAEAALWQYNVLDVCIGTAEQVPGFSGGRVLI